MAATDLRVGEYGGSTSTVDTGTTDALSRQPETFDYSQSNQFKIYLPIFPLEHVSIQLTEGFHFFK